MRRIPFLLLLILCALPLRAGEYETLYRNLPVALTEPAAPVIPALTVSLLDFGAVGDGIADNTAAFEKAVAALAKQGGGHTSCRRVSS